MGSEMCIRDRTYQFSEPIDVARLDNGASATNNTSDGLNGGDPDSFETLTDTNSDWSVGERGASGSNHTSDGPNGGDPGDFERLTNTNSNWSAREPSFFQSLLDRIRS